MCLYWILTQSKRTALKTGKWHRLSWRVKVLLEEIDYPLPTAPAYM